MKKLISIFLLVLFTGLVQAVEVADINGMWLIKSYKEMEGGEKVTADGTDFWEFSGSKYAVYASGFKFPELEYTLSGNTIVIKKDSGDQTVTIDSLAGDTMQANDGKYEYHLVKQ